MDFLMTLNGLFFGASLVLILVTVLSDLTNTLKFIIVMATIMFGSATWMFLLSMREIINRLPLN